MIDVLKFVKFVQLLFQTFLKIVVLKWLYDKRVSSLTANLFLSLLNQIPNIKYQIALIRLTGPLCLNHVPACLFMSMIMHDVKK